jgi:hypothetical protein
MSGHLSFSFSDPDAGLHCFGRSGECRDPRLDARASSRCRSRSKPQAIWPTASTSRSPESARRCLSRSEPLRLLRAPGRRASLCRLRGSAAGGRELSGFGCVTVAAADRGGLALRRSSGSASARSSASRLVSERDLARAGGHGDEQVAAFVARGAPLEASALEDPRLSSTYREDGQLLRAGLELWEGDDESDGGSARDSRPRLRIAGETIARARARRGRTRAAAVAFLVWHYDGPRGNRRLRDRADADLVGRRVTVAITSAAGSPSAASAEAQFGLPRRSHM